MRYVINVSGYKTYTDVAHPDLLGASKNYTINGRIVDSLNAAIPIVQEYIGRPCSFGNATGSGAADGSGDEIVILDDQDQEVATVTTIPLEKDAK